MSSLHKQGNKPNFFCAFYDPEGFRRFRSTGSRNFRVARAICSAIERASVLARHGKLSEQKALKLIRETCAAVQEMDGKLAADAAMVTLKASVEEFVKIAGGDLVTYTIRDWLTSWLTGRTDASPATRAEYHRTIGLFGAFLGARADRPLAVLQPKQIEDFKAELAQRVAPSTVNKAIKVLKAAFGAAVARRQLEFNPAQHVTPVETEESQRRPFTMDEIKRVLAAANDEWRTMVLVGFYTGLRLRDCAGLTWAHVDLLAGQISIATQKTNRRVIVPLAEPLAKHLATLAGDKADVPLCPSLCGKGASWLSAQFHKVMVAAGIALKRTHESKGKGRNTKREASQVSFHSLRHNTTSALKNAGVSEAIAMDIVGHETKAVSRNYTKIDAASKRQAINRLPDITRDNADRTGEAA